MSAITRIFSAILAFLQLFFGGVSYGEFGEIIKTETEKSELVNNPIVIYNSHFISKEGSPSCSLKKKKGFDLCGYLEP